MPTPLPIAHLRDVYLRRTETFIYRCITSITGFEVRFFARQLTNLNLFPFPRLSVTSRAWDWERFVNRAAMKYLHRKALGITHLAYRKPIRQQRIALLHAHFGFTGVDMWPLAEELQIPLVTTFYGRDMSALPRHPYWRRAYGRLFAQGDAFFVEGSHMKEELVKLGCPPQKIEIMHIGVSIDDMPFPQPKQPASGRKVVALICGRFCEKKGIPHAVRALHILAQARYDVELRLIGDGELRPEIEKLIRNLGLQERATLLGVVDYEHYLKELQQAHILLAPSVTAEDGDTEGGAPTVIIEAQAIGVPVVATRHADIPEVVIHEATGLLVEEGDPEALAAAVARLCDNPEARVAMGQQGRRHILEEYDINKVTRAMEGVYRELLRAKG